MIKSRQDLRYYLSEDLKRYGGKAPGLKDWLICNESWYIYHLVRNVRFMEYYENRFGKKHPLYWFYFYLYKRLSFRLHITLYTNTIGPGLRIYHAGGFIHVGPNCKIGRHCTLLPGVVFGNKYEHITCDRIIVGDNCYFGLDAKVFGSVNIGNNVSVGANAVVTKDIPENAIVGGVPAKIIKVRTL